jgi:hypothetical protein
MMTEKFKSLEIEFCSKLVKMGMKNLYLCVDVTNVNLHLGQNVPLKSDLNFFGTFSSKKISFSLNYFSVFCHKDKLKNFQPLHIILIFVSL